MPYDDQLVYCNGYTQLTKGVHGDVGGPPLELDKILAVRSAKIDVSCMYCCHDPL
ncbi:hypothetical protein KSB_60150 [Ktedonobacter robiniae]|uniref:Uncharacterized protein n=1 Tax=Ktedonobacter robiniae TaxID=2778365 RepID=A0ABQ3UXX6_9CHLR|nr:hypothetical protein KSB_60150 [Ktedonobacter robiniae]